MSELHRRQSDARAVRRATNAIQNAPRVVAVITGGGLLAGLLAACSAAPPGPVSGRDPSDPSSRVAAAGYRSVIDPYKSERPVGPAPWIEQNQQVAPARKR